MFLHSAYLVTFFSALRKIIKNGANFASFELNLLVLYDPPTLDPRSFDYELLATLDERG